MYFWCDTPTATGYTDYLEISYSTGGIYAPLLKVDEDLLSWLGTEVAFGTHTGAYDWWPVSFTASGSAQLRFRWISDSITQLDQNNDPHYGCLIYNTIQEIARDRGITGTYKYNDGTSFSSPMVAGAAALALGQNS